MQRRDDELRLEEIGRAVADWALGLGLLRAHLAVFTVGAVALVMTDLYRSPADLRADGWLRLWAVVLGCHTAALLAGWATWRAVRPHRLAGPLGSASASTAVAVARPAPAAAEWPTTGPGRNGRSA